MSHMKKTCLHILILLFFLLPLRVSALEPDDMSSMLDHPEAYIKITDWSFYVAARVAIIHHLTIENTADIAYKDVKIKVYYYSTNPPDVGELISSTSGVLRITLPPKSKRIYLKGGSVLGAGSFGYRAGNIEVLSAVPITDDKQKSDNPPPDLPKLTL